MKQTNNLTSGITLWMLVLLTTFFCGLSTKAQILTYQKIDSLKSTLHNIESGNQYIKSSFAIADNFMEIDQYDSSQIWLNKIAVQLPLKKPSIDAYFLSSRQAEVYYYNGLQRLGLQESERSLSIANVLGDSLLLADAYNFIGLFNMNLDSDQEAVSYFKKGILFATQPPYPSSSLSLTKPHHLYCNLAEVYTKLARFDSAIYCSNTSFKLAKEIKSYRGIALAQNMLGDIFLKQNKTDSALTYYNASVNASLMEGDFDVELLSYGGAACAYTMNNNKETALSLLQKGTTLLKNNPQVNNLFAEKFFDNAIFIYKKYELYALLTEVLITKSNLLKKQSKYNNEQMNIILNAGLLNETRLLKLQVDQIKQQNESTSLRLYFVIAVFLAGVGLFFLYRYGANQRLRNILLQNKISKDLHDDVGSSLSSLHVYSTVANRLLHSNPTKASDMLNKISEQTVSLMENIGDIVWSMKSGTEQGININMKIKNFVAGVLSAANINYSIQIEDELDLMVRNIAAKRNILMIIKEAVNNIVKYSKASMVIVSVKKTAENIMVEIKDNGKGFNVHLSKDSGDGLLNMKKRTEELRGHFEIKSELGEGTQISAILPLTIISDPR